MDKSKALKSTAFLQSFNEFLADPARYFAVNNSQLSQVMRSFFNEQWFNCFDTQFIESILAVDDATEVLKLIETVEN
jgi:hypothetical protein